MLLWCLLLSSLNVLCVFFFFNDTATTEIYTLSLHDALPIYASGGSAGSVPPRRPRSRQRAPALGPALRESPGRAAGAGDSDRKSTRLNSSHLGISYAVFCLKKKKTATRQYRVRIHARTCYTS